MWWHMGGGMIGTTPATRTSNTNAFATVLCFNNFFLAFWHSHISTKLWLKWRQYFKWAHFVLGFGLLRSCHVLWWQRQCQQSSKKFDNIVDKFAFLIFHDWISKCGSSPIITLAELVWLCRTVFFGVYKCWGPGAEAVRGVTWARELDFETAHPFLVKSFVNGRHWIAPSDA